MTGGHENTALPKPRFPDEVRGRLRGIEAFICATPRFPSVRAYARFIQLRRGVYRRDGVFPPVCRGKHAVAPGTTGCFGASAHLPQVHVILIAVRPSVEGEGTPDAKH